MWNWKVTFCPLKLKTQNLGNVVSRNSRKKKHKLDVIAETSKHTDSPQNHSPVLTLGDVNCSPHSLSNAGFGDDSKHIEIRAKIVIESVFNKEKYLNHEYLSQGAVEVCEDVTLPEIFTMFSGQNAAGLSDNIVENVYEKEIMSLTKKGSYMGMWQLFDAANVLAHPIRSIFPLRGSAQFQRNFNCMCMPIDGRHRRKNPLTIIWTPSVANGPIHHFVPLLPH